MTIKRLNQKGFMALSSVLLVSAVVLSIAVSVTLLSIGETQASLAVIKGEKALNLVEGCMEDALLKVRSSNTYTGGTISRPDGACSVTVTSNSNTYTITATTNATDYSRTIQAIVVKTNQIVIQSWKEI